MAKAAEESPPTNGSHFRKEVPEKEGNHSETRPPQGRDDGCEVPGDRDEITS